MDYDTPSDSEISGHGSQPLTHNRTDYTVKEDLGLVVNRQHYTVNSAVKSFTASTTGGNLTLPPPIEIEFKLSRSAFVDGRNSYLSFRIDTTLDSESPLIKAAYGFGEGSACNWIKNIKVKGGDGQVLDDLTDPALFMTYNDRYNKDASYFESINPSQGDMKGYNKTLADTTREFVCPLSELIPLFNYGKLLPANLLGDMRILIELNHPHDVLKYTDLTVPPAPPVPTPFTDFSYTISKVFAHLDTYTMDSYMINLINAQPFVIEYKTYKTVKKAYSTDLHFPSLRSVSRATRAFCVTQASPVSKSDRVARDSMLSEPLDLKDYRWRVGNRFQPSQPIESDVVSLAHTLASMGKLSQATGNISMNPSLYNNGLNCFAVNLRRAGCGTPLNNNNELTLMLRHSAQKKRQATMFVKYRKRIHVDPVKVEGILMGLRETINVSE